MTRPVPPELLARMREHECWLETFKKEGQQFVQQGGDLHNLDLSGRDIAWVALLYLEINTDQIDLPYNDCIGMESKAKP